MSIFIALHVYDFIFFMLIKLIINIDQYKYLAILALIKSCWLLETQSFFITLLFCELMVLTLNPNLLAIDAAVIPEDMYFNTKHSQGDKTVFSVLMGVEFGTFIPFNIK